MAELRHPRPVTAATLTIRYPEKDSAEERRRFRAGKRRAVIEEARNGLPVSRPYAYRGTGRDVFRGQYGDPWLDAPYRDEPGG